jgi:hypothetical protein
MVYRRMGPKDTHPPDYFKHCSNIIKFWGKAFVLAVEPF